MSKDPNSPWDFDEQDNRYWKRVFFILAVILLLLLVILRAEGLLPPPIPIIVAERIMDVGDDPNVYSGCVGYCQIGPTNYAISEEFFELILIQWTTVTNATYFVERTTNFMNWQKVSTNFIGTGSPLEWYVWGDLNSQFIRVVKQ